MNPWTLHFYPSSSYRVEMYIIKFEIMTLVKDDRVAIGTLHSGFLTSRRCAPECNSNPSLFVGLLPSKMDSPKTRIKSLIEPFKLFTRKLKRDKKSALALDSHQMEDHLKTAFASTSLVVPTVMRWSESLHSLPNELLEHICLQLHPLEVVKCRLVCLFRRFKELVDGSTELQLRIDLAIDGYLLSYRGDHPANDVRAFHEKRRNAIESMKYVATWEEPFPEGDRGQYEVRDGILAQGLGDHSTVGGFKTLVYKELLPPQSRKKPWVHTWKDLGLLPTDFSFWIQGDLQILVESRDNGRCRRVHFRTLSTNQPHPKSTAPYVDIVNDNYTVWSRCFTTSCEDRVAVMFWESGGATRRGAALVIDCTEAKIIMPYTLVNDLEFSSRDEALLLFCGQGGYGTSVAVYSFPLQRVLCTCQFPFPRAPSQARYMTRPDSRIQDNCPVPLEQSLVTDPELNIAVVGFTFLRINSLVCVISVHRFRQMYISLLQKHSGRQIFTWEEWGPTVTRWFPSQLQPTGTDNIFGCRMVICGNPSFLHPQCWSAVSLILLDFNPRPIRHGAITRVNGESQTVVIDQESVVGDVHQRVLIKSSLPYRAFTTLWILSSANYRFDGTTIIARGQNVYRFYSFLPLETNEEHDPSVRV
ncbi:hypothetical protein CPB86DRAFT_306880 [Serendipita vermifera]|nr:hypothetical protein CPB86DRAFT_306880 [Serendipita vermifera]